MDLLEEFKSPSAVRRMAALGRLAREELLDDEEEAALTWALRCDLSPIVRHEAAFVMGDLKDRGIIGELPFHDDLLIASRDNSVLVRHEAALSLSSFPGAATVKRLREMMLDPVDDVRVSAAHALEEMDVE